MGDIKLESTTDIVQLVRLGISVMFERASVHVSASTQDDPE